MSCRTACVSIISEAATTRNSRTSDHNIYAQTDQTNDYLYVNKHKNVIINTIHFYDLDLSKDIYNMARFLARDFVHVICIVATS